MRISTPKSTSTFRRPTPLRRKVSQPPPTTTSIPKEGFEAKSSVSDSLAICLFGFTRTMYDSEYEEEMRKRAIMAEVLPDEVMWAAWAKNEAPLRQGRGWYPALDRHFLELLVISEIHCLAHPIHGLAGQPGQAERIHRHASRVRRVACERIGAERLHAYCDRVKEAFEAYMHGAWGGAVRDFDTVDNASTSEDETEDEVTSPISPIEAEGEGEGEVEVDVDVEGEEGRGRKREKGEGSVQRMEHPDPGDLPGSPKVTIHKSSDVAEDPFIDQELDKEERELDMIVQGLEADGELLRIDLDDVQEGDEDEIPVDASEKTEVEGMDIDIQIDLKPSTDLLGVSSAPMDLPTSVPSSPMPDEAASSSPSTGADLIKPTMTVSSAVRA